MHFHKPQEKPSRWGSFADVQYAIWDNLEKIYGCDHESEVLIMPLFWGFPLLDYSVNGHKTTNHSTIYKDGNISFNGTNAYTTTDAAIGNLNDFTVAGWFYRKTAAGEDFYWSLGYNNTNSMLVFWNSESSEFLRIIIATISFTSNVTLIPNQWQHIVITRSGSTMTVYVDLSSDSATPSANTINQKFELGYAVTRAKAGSYFNGATKEIRIAKTARTADQIALFNDNKYGLYQPVGRPIWSIPAVGVTIPIFMQNMRGSFNSPGTRGGFIN